MRKILKDSIIIVSVILLTGVLIYFIYRPNIECRNSLNQIEIPFLRAKRGKELVKRIQEEWKIAFDVFLKNNENIELDSEKNALLKASCYVIIVPKKNIFEEYKIISLEDKQKIIAFNYHCKIVCKKMLDKFLSKK